MRLLSIVQSCIGKRRVGDEGTMSDDDDCFRARVGTICRRSRPLLLLQLDTTRLLKVVDYIYPI